MFKAAGCSKSPEGLVKVRFATDMIARIKNLTKNQHADVNIVELPNEMDKPEIIKFLLTSELMSNPEFKQAIEDADVKYNGVKVVKAAKVAKTAKVKVKAPSLDVLKARAAEVIAD